MLDFTCKLDAGARHHAIPWLEALNIEMSRLLDSRSIDEESYARADNSRNLLVFLPK